MLPVVAGGIVRSDRRRQKETGDCRGKMGWDILEAVKRIYEEDW